MSRHWAVILVAATFLSAGTSLGVLIAPRSVEAAKEPPPSPARIAYVNIAQVLREFKKAIADGRKLTAKRQEVIAKSKPLREAFDLKAKDFRSSVNAGERETLEKELKVLKQEIEKLDAEGQKLLGAMTDQAILDVFQNINDAIAEMAKERDLDVVECYPDASSLEDSKKPAIAQLKLQSPALMPFYIRKELLITQELIERLNKRYPPEKIEKK